MRHYRLRRSGIPGYMSPARRDEAERVDEDGAAMVDRAVYVGTLDTPVDPEKALIEKQRMARLEYHIDQMSPRYGLAFRMFVGLRCVRRTLDQIGEIFNLSRERIRQMVARVQRVVTRKLLLEENKGKFHAHLKAERAEDERRLNAWKYKAPYNKVYGDTPPLALPPKLQEQAETYPLPPFDPIEDELRRRRYKAWSDSADSRYRALCRTFGLEHLLPSEAYYAHMRGHHRDERI